MQDTDNRFQNNKAESDGQQETKSNRINSIIKSISRPLRIFQFMVSLEIFVLVIYAIASGNRKVSFVTCILLIILSGVYVFVLAVDLISQYSGGELHAIPTLLFSFLGTIFFGIAAALVISVYSAAGTWYILTILCLCILMCILCMIHVAMVLAFWKRKCNACKQCCYAHQAEILKSDFCHPMCTETVKYDLMTSVSNLRIPSGDEDGVVDHSYRKVGYGHRRQYIDCPTSARTVSIVDVAEVQTEPHTMCTVHSQTQREVKEIPVQTVSRCELCNRQMQFFPTSSAAAQPAAQQTQCAPCPALVQLIRGVPCCPGCRCVTGIVQLQQQQEQQKQEQPTKEQVQWVQSMDEKPYGMLTSAENKQEDSKMKEMSGTITKLTVASYTVAPSKKTNTSSQTTEADDVKIVKKTPESVESKKLRVNIAKREKGREKEVAKKEKEILIPEREKEKATNDAKKEPPRPSLKKPGEPTTGKLVEFAPIKSSDILSVDSIPQKSSVSVAEKPSNVTLNEALKVPEAITVSPSQQVARIINRLQEIEGNKGDLQQDEDSQASTSKEETVSIKDKTVKAQTVAKKLNESEDTVEQNKINVRAAKMEETRSIDGKDGRKVWIKSAVSDGTVSDVTLEDSETLHGSKQVSQEDSGALKEGVKKSVSGGKSENDKSKFDKSITEKVERSLDTASMYQPQMGTQTMQAEDSGSRSKKTHLIRKKNKVEPAELTHADMNVQTLEAEDYDEISTASTRSKPESERLFTGEKEISVEDKAVNICPSCKRIQASTSSSFRYYSVHRDKRGRLYCEYCATANSIKVLHGNDSSGEKRLRCAGCGNFLRIKTSQDESFRNKSDNCPKCGQVQVRVHSAPSK